MSREKDWAGEIPAQIDARNVDTIAALRALTAGSRRGVVTVLGYTAAGDGGGGTFRWDAASTAGDDAGVTILPTGLSGAGRWVRLFTGAVLAEWFGAAGDGTTDDTASITAALTYATGATVALRPSKTYFIGSIDIPANTTVNAERATLKAKTNIGAGSPANMVVMNSGSKFLGGKIDGNAANQTAAVSGVNFNGSTVHGAVVRCVEITGMYRGHGVVFPTATSATITRCVIEDNYFHDIDKSAITSYLATGATMTACTVRGNKCTVVGGYDIGGQGSAVIQLSGGGGSHLYRDCVVTDNILWDLGTLSIPMEIVHGDRFIVADNVISGTSTRGISCGDCFYSTFTGNSVTDQTAYGFEMNSMTQCSFTGNVISNCRCCFEGTGTTFADLTFTGNTMYGTLAVQNADGIRFPAGASVRRITIVGNTFTNISSAGISCLSQSVAQDILIDGNQFLLQPVANWGPIPDDSTFAIIYNCTNLQITNNKIVIGQGGTGPTHAAIKVGLFSGGDTIQIDRNVITNTRGSVLDNTAIVLVTYAPRALIRDNTITGYAVGIDTSGLGADDTIITDNLLINCTTPYALKSTHTRLTVKMYEAAAAPTTGTWAVADYVRNTAPAEAGSGGSKYVITGWVCSVAGTPGTWLPMRSLTGN